MGEHLPALVWSLSQRVHAFPAQEDLGFTNVPKPPGAFSLTGFLLQVPVPWLLFLVHLVVV